MPKRITKGLAAGLLAAALLPGSATAAGKDSVTGTATFNTLDDSRAWVNAHSDADGTNPRGTYRITDVASGLALAAEVVCLHVDGKDAVAGAVVTSSNSAGIPVGTELLHYVNDAGAPGTSDTSVTAIDAPATLCATFPPPFALQPVQSGNWVVRDR
jgi:hypothetical protein